jgi:hypothetical protein
MRSNGKSKANREAKVTVSFSDSVNVGRNHVQWTPKGVQLLTKWPFAEGTELEFAFDYRGERHCHVGVVVACHPLKEPAGLFETVLYFIETPCHEHRKAARDCRLAPEDYLPEEESRLSGMDGTRA